MSKEQTTTNPMTQRVVSSYGPGKGQSVGTLRPDYDVDKMNNLINKGKKRVGLICF